ncbi:NADH:ubiquinone oxidoreductase subunit [Fusarium sp. NRRL 52700]|nr:NADH:ubiquinone oxidoreductase subunit [Fusarium sp. NRRL 52700]
MASGYGMNGGKSTKGAPRPRTTSQTFLGLTASSWTPGVGRCFPFWQEVMGCYVVNTTAADDSGKKKCGLVLEDYYECLHHKKEHARALAMQAAYARSESATARDDAPSVKQIRSLGLIDKEEDTKKVLGQS